MTRGADADRPLRRGGILQLLAQPRDDVGFGFGLGDPVAEHRRRVELTRIIENETLLRETFRN